MSRVKSKGIANINIYVYRYRVQIQGRDYRYRELGTWYMFLLLRETIVKESREVDWQIT